MRKHFIFLVGLAAIIAVNVYIFFRIGTLIYTLWATQETAAYFVTIAFWMAEVFVLMHAIGYFISILSSLGLYRRATVSYSATHQAHVNILIPVHDEPIDVLRRTLVAARYVDYQHYVIVVLDASEQPVNSQAVKALCKEQGVEYFEVPYPRHGAKAGSLNEYLRHTRSPYIAVLDADYRASRDFLKLLVPQLENNPRLAYIQTPQFYGNLTDSMVSRAAQIQQALFFEYICEAKGVHGAMFMCGTNLIIRTSALRQVNGFDESSITEDFATSMTMMQCGWESRYYNFTTAFGDGPRNLREYFRQQYRWARGTLGVFLRMAPVVLSPRHRLTIGQRFELLLSGTHYFIGVVWMILIIIPILYIIWQVPVYLSDPRLYLYSYIPYFVFSMYFFFETFLSRRYRANDWLKATSLMILAVPVYFRAAIDALIGRKSRFQQTRKDAAIDEIPWDELWPQLTLIAACIIAAVVAGFRLWFGGLDLALAINAWWCLFHAWLLSYFLFHLYVHRQHS